MIQQRLETVPFDTPFLYEGTMYRCVDHEDKPEYTVGIQFADGSLGHLPWGTTVQIEPPVPMRVGGDTLRLLDEAITKRKSEWQADPSKEVVTPSLSFRGCELAGEAGEVCNEIKKLERHRLGMVGGKSDTSDLADELGDTIICAALVARQAGIDLAEAVRVKFNKTSDKHGFKTKL